MCFVVGGNGGNAGAAAIQVRCWLPLALLSGGSQGAAPRGRGSACLPAPPLPPRLGLGADLACCADLAHCTDLARCADVALGVPSSEGISVTGL
jgi:hypothetical protein